MAKKQRGRPSKFDPLICEQATKLCMLGATDKELADFFHITESTLNLWKTQHPEFSESLKQGKDYADANVASKLYHRAIGYDCDDTHFSSYEGEVTATPYRKHYPPDPTSCIFWLKNRRRQNWRDLESREPPTAPPIGDQDIMELARRVAFMLHMGAMVMDKNESPNKGLN